MKRESWVTIGSGARKTPPRWAPWEGVALVLAVVLAVAGCQPKQQLQTEEPQSPTTRSNPDPLAVGAAIDDSGSVAPGTVDLSKGAGSRIQWRNDAKDTMMVLFKGAPIGELIPPGQLSASHRVCLMCTNGYYEYAVLRMVKGVPTDPNSGPPGEPQVGVGD